MYNSFCLTAVFWYSSTNHFVLVLKNKSVDSWNIDIYYLHCLTAPTNLPKMFSQVPFVGLAAMTQCVNQPAVTPAPHTDISSSPGYSTSNHLRTKGLGKQQMCFGPRGRFWRSFCFLALTWQPSTWGHPGVSQCWNTSPFQSSSCFFLFLFQNKQQ